MFEEQREPQWDYMRTQTRRHFLRTTGSGLGAAALGMMFGGTIAEVMAEAGKDISEIISMTTAK